MQCPDPVTLGHHRAQGDAALAFCVQGGVWRVIICGSKKLRLSDAPGF